MFPYYSRPYIFLGIIKKPKDYSCYFDTLIELEGERIFWDIQDKEYWELLRVLWLKNEVEIYGMANIWMELFAIDKGCKEYFMKESERAFLKELPDEITIYRGYVKTKPTEHMEEFNLKWWGSRSCGDSGFSYTLSKDIGTFYFKKYKRYNEKIPPNLIKTSKKESELFVGTIKKDRIFSYINEKNEDEILVIESGRYTSTRCIQGRIVYF